MENHSIHELLTVALRAAVGASKAIMQIYTGDFSNELKPDGSPITHADLASNTLLETHLQVTNIPILTEESIHAHYDERQHWETLWCVDPLDGTKEFIKKNDEFAVCIALIHQKQPILGVIASPVNQHILIGGKAVPAAIIDFDSIETPENWTFIEQKKQVNSPLVIIGSRSHTSPNEQQFNQEITAKFGEQITLSKGSALKFFDLALGIADVYPRFAPTMEWDIAAGQAILESLGGSVIEYETGKSLTYNKSNLVNPHFVARSFATLHHN